MTKTIKVDDENIIDQMAEKKSKEGIIKIKTKKVKKQKGVIPDYVQPLDNSKFESSKNLISSEGI